MVRWRPGQGADWAFTAPTCYPSTVEGGSQPDAIPSALRPKKSRPSPKSLEPTTQLGTGRPAMQVKAQPGWPKLSVLITLMPPLGLQAHAAELGE
ncbi:hypothetical protein ACLOJK_007615 [Asimina triloba]